MEKRKLTERDLTDYELDQFRAALADKSPPHLVAGYSPEKLMLLLAIFENTETKFFVIEGLKPAHVDPLLAAHRLPTSKIRLSPDPTAPPPH